MTNNDKRRSKRKHIIVLIFFCCFFNTNILQFLATTPNPNSKEAVKEEFLSPPKTASISILSDDDWDNYGVIYGSGSPSDPWIIEDLVIDAGGSTGIEIFSTTLNFKIRNCTIYNCLIGIYIKSIYPDKGEIYNNTIYDCTGNTNAFTGIGLKIELSNKVNIHDNHIYDCTGGTATFSGLGILLKDSNNCTVTKNKIHWIRNGGAHEDSATGICTSYSSSNIIKENEIYHCSNFGSGYTQSGNGIQIGHGNENIILNNTIHSNIGSNARWTGNGIFLDESWAHADSNQIINNTIYNNTAGTGENSGNGILMWGNYESNRIRETQVIGNLIYNNSGTGPNSGNGIWAQKTEDNVITGNTILNCFSGNGIHLYLCDTSSIVGNKIDNIVGNSNYRGNGIILHDSNNNDITDNNISNVLTTTGDSGGNGILFKNSDYNTISDNSIINASNSGASAYSGWGINFEYYSYYNEVIRNNITSIDTSGIQIAYNINYNKFKYNNLGTARIRNDWRYGSANNDNNEYVGNKAGLIYVYSGSNNLIEDNIVAEITVDVSSSNTIVGNFNTSGGIPIFTYKNGATEVSQYFLKITSPEAGKTYNGAGGIELKYKYQYKGYELSWLRYVLDGEADQCPRKDGVIYIPWKSGSPYITLYANDTNDSSWSYDSKSISFTYNDISNETVLSITNNEELESYKFSGSGTILDPYIIKNKIIAIPEGTPDNSSGVLIQNTDAYFKLKDSIIIGRFATYGIMLKNVKNAEFDNVSIIGLPHSYIPNDVSIYSGPVDRGFYLDSDCQNNIIKNCNIFRTYTFGIIVEGDSNSIENNRIANAYGYGLNIIGDSNTVLNNDIATFGGPDYNNYYYNFGDSQNVLSGIVIGGSGSNNLIQGNSIRMYPECGIEIEGASNLNNIIVENEFEECTTNISDSGTETHFTKINYPLDGAIYTANTPLAAFGYYSGTEGFQDIEDGSFPSEWAITGNGTGYLSQVIENRTDSDGIDHKKILYTYAGIGSNPEINVTRDFGENITSGTIEFWVLRNGDDSGSADFAFLGPNGTLFAILLENGNFAFQDNLATTDTGISFENNIWYRLSVDFSADGLYAGLGSHQYKFRIYNSSGDALLYESINADYGITNNCSGFQITAQGGPSSNMSIYSDAIGYSWHSGYEIGDNRYEGMFISPALQLGYKNWTWIGYSLNGENVIELPSFGDGIIPLPNTLGEQTLQLYMNKSLDYQTNSPITHFTYNFDRKVNILSHYENGELAAENTILKAGLARLEENIDLNITVSYSTEKLGSDTYTNASIYYKINQGTWMGPYDSGSNLGTHNFTYIIDQTNYSLGDTLDYYLMFQQYESSGKFLQCYYWTQEGIFYFESEAQVHAFHKKISPIPYQLSLNYSVFYEAERTEEIESDLDGYTITMTGMAPVAMANFTLNYLNKSSSLKEFSANFDIHVNGLTHDMYEENSTILNTVTGSITAQDNVRSPFILSDDLELVESVTNISIPVMLFETTIAEPENNLIFTGDILNLTYKGIKNDWFYGNRGLKVFESYFGDIFATIRYDASTGIMVFYNYNDFTTNESKSIYFGLYDNNQSYAINLNIEKREELDDISQDFVNVTLDGILYDPPGDHSYTQMSAGTSMTTGWSLETQAGTEYQQEAQILYYGLGAETDTYKIDTEGGVYEFELTRTYKKTLTSSINSDDPDLIGPGGGDLYYGSGIYVLYKFYVNNYYYVVNESDPVNYPYNDIRVFTFGSRVEYTFTPNTTFSVLGAYLDDVNMSELEDENIFEDNAITGEEGSYIHELQNSPLFWTPSSVYEFGYSSSTTEMKGFHSYMEYSAGTYFVWDQYISFSVGGSVNAFLGSVSWSYAYNLYSTSGKLATLNTWSKDFLGFETVTTEDQILVHLEDDDGSPIGLHDQFKMNMYNDTRYNSIGFIIDTNATFTSGPHEYFTGDRRPPTVCEFIDLSTYLKGDITLEVVAIDEEINGEEENNIFKVDFYFDDDPVFGIDSILIGTHGEPEKSPSDDPELFWINWDSKLLNGEYYLFAEAWDYGYPLSNSYLSYPILVQLDNIDPDRCELFIEEPYYGAINLYSKVSDEGCGISYVEYWDGDPNSKDSVLLGKSDVSSSSYNFIWVTDPNGDDAGIHQIYAVAYDKAGNYLISEKVEIQVLTEAENAFSNISTTEGIIIVLGSSALAASLVSLLRPRLSRVRSRPKSEGSRAPPEDSQKSDSKAENIDNRK